MFWSDDLFSFFSISVLASLAASTAFLISAELPFFTMAFSTCCSEVVNDNNGDPQIPSLIYMRCFEYGRHCSYAVRHSLKMFSNSALPLARLWSFASAACFCSYTL